MPANKLNDITLPLIRANMAYLGRSNSTSYSREMIWSEKYNDEILNAYCLILSFISKSNQIIAPIASLDIETTNWIPSAMQGYVNIICQSILEKTKEGVTLSTYQIINMNRKPENVGVMLQHIWAYLNTQELPQFGQLLKENRHFPHTQLVFNKNFDILILEKCISNFGLEFNFPPQIYDLMKEYPSLEYLEKELATKIGFNRVATAKGNFNEYYSLFKKNKVIEPLSTYNIMDTLSPLLAFLINSQI